MRKLIIVLSLLLVSLVVYGADQDVSVNVLSVPEIFLGDNPGSSTDIDNDGTVYATLDNNDATLCEINWNNGFENIDPSLTEASNTYFSLGEKIVEYRCGSSELDFVTVQDSIEVTEVPCAIQINSPVEGNLFDTSKVPIDVIINERVVDVDYSIDGGRNRRLCKNCEVYNRTKRLNDGNHILEVIASDRKLPICREMVNITVDSKKPKIKKTLPNRNKFTNGSFSVKYDEAFLKRVSLIYGNDTLLKIERKENCSAGDDKTCFFYVDLHEFDGQIIEYFFRLRDNFFRIESKILEVNVDTTTPEITKLNFTLNGRRVEFDILISEDVNLEYFDEDARRTKWKRLCRNCDSYDRKKSFSRGNHTVLIRATDSVGNMDQKSIFFSI